MCSATHSPQASHVSWRMETACRIVAHVFPTRSLRFRLLTILKNAYRTLGRRLHSSSLPSQAEESLPNIVITSVPCAKLASTFLQEFSTASCQFAAATLSPSAPFSCSWRQASSLCTHKACPRVPFRGELLLPPSSRSGLLQSTFPTTTREKSALFLGVVGL